MDRCGQVVGLLGASDVAVSRDGAHVYVASATTGALLGFVRDGVTGALTKQQCISDSGSDGLCIDGTGLAGARAVAIAEDGADVYVVAVSGAVTGYRRDPATGLLQSHTCLLDRAPGVGSCRGAPRLGRC